MKKKQMKQQILAAMSAGLISLGMVGSAGATLIGRLPVTPGGTDYQAYYDPSANLTWLADANAGAGSVFDNGFSPADGAMTWGNATDWVAGLSVGGIGGWRLANTDTSCSTTYNCTGSEMGNLFYNTLGNTAQPGPSEKTGPFSNARSAVFYWTATEYALNHGRVWYFNMHFGSQGLIYKSASGRAWAVHSGNVISVPEPSTVWLFGSGLIGLIGLARRQR